MDGGTMAPDEPRVLSVQSHVVSGYVGNKSATFPLQLLGFEVDAVNSVQFSNHKGYPAGTRGQVLEAEQLGELLEGLRMNGLDRYTHLINGYIGSVSFLRKFGSVVGDLRKKNPGLVYVCDPVMGDAGPGIYVPKELVPIYREEIIPQSNVCLPNQFEAELLTDVAIKNEQDALQAIKKIHDLGVEIVILSSVELKDKLTAIGSKVEGGEVYKIEIPKFPAHFVGTGDLFTALITAWLTKTGFDLAQTLEKTIATMQALLKNTLEYATKNPAKTIELRLIQSKGCIENPTLMASLKSLPL